uniref:Uncharacterized protein n=1 Tax=Paracoccus marcusii TaxID=59779 RepID=J7K719_9RHOB|nr:hypothetical protein [Paracoccus marcusii]
MNWLLWHGRSDQWRDHAPCHDPGRTEVVDDLVQRLEAEVGLEGVRDAPGQTLAGEPVHDGHQIEEAMPHRQIGDVGAPDLTGAVHTQPAQQIRVGLVALARLAGIKFLVDRHQAHKPEDPLPPSLST